MKINGDKPVQGAPQTGSTQEGLAPEGDQTLSVFDKHQIKQSPDTAVASRKVAKLKAGYVQQLIDFARDWLFGAAPTPEYKKPDSTQSNGESGLSLGKDMPSEAHMLWAIHRAGDFPPPGPDVPDPESLPVAEPYAPEPDNRPTLDIALESPDQAQKYVQNTDNCEMNLDQLLSAVKAKTSKEERDIFKKHF